MEKAGLEHVRWLLKIIEADQNHKLFLSVKSLRELSASPFHYIVLVIPRPLPEEPIKGEHFVLAEFFKSISGNSSQASSAQAEVVEGGLVKFVRPNQFPLAEQDPQPTP